MLAAVVALRSCSQMPLGRRVPTVIMWLRKRCMRQRHGPAPPGAEAAGSAVPEWPYAPHDADQLPELSELSVRAVGATGIVERHPGTGTNWPITMSPN